MLHRLNEGEAVKAEEIALWCKDIHDLFEYLKQNAKLISMMEDDNFSREDRQREYNKSIRKFLRQIDNRTWEDLFEPLLFKEMIINNKDQFFFMLMDYLAGDEVYDYYQSHLNNAAPVNIINNNIHIDQFNQGCTNITINSDQNAK